MIFAFFSVYNYINIWRNFILFQKVWKYENTKKKTDWKVCEKAKTIKSVHKSHLKIGKSRSCSKVFNMWTSYNNLLIVIKTNPFNKRPKDQETAFWVNYSFKTTDNRANTPLSHWTWHLWVAFISLFHWWTDMIHWLSE